MGVAAVRSLTGLDVLGKVWDSAATGRSSMVMHHMKPLRRAVAYVFPAIIVVIAALAAPAFIDTGRIWWLAAILVLPLILAIVVCVEYSASAIGFDASGVHFRSVGYRLHAPWETVVLEPDGGAPVLRVTGAMPEFFPWLGFMYRLLAIFLPRRASLAKGMMSTIPLYAFDNAYDDELLRSLCAGASPLKHRTP